MGGGTGQDQPQKHQRPRFFLPYPFTTPLALSRLFLRHFISSVSGCPITIMRLPLRCIIHGALARELPLLLLYASWGQMVAPQAYPEVLKGNCESFLLFECMLHTFSPLPPHVSVHDPPCSLLKTDVEIVKIANCLRIEKQTVVWCAVVVEPGGRCNDDDRLKRMPILTRGRFIAFSHRRRMWNDVRGCVSVAISFCFRWWWWLLCCCCCCFCCYFYINWLPIWHRCRSVTMTMFWVRDMCVEWFLHKYELVKHITLHNRMQQFKDV